MRAQYHKGDVTIKVMTKEGRKEGRKGMSVTSAILSHPHHSNIHILTSSPIIHHLGIREIFLSLYRLPPLSQLTSFCCQGEEYCVCRFSTDLCLFVHHEMFPGL
jgi:hypothetical protein